MAGKVWIYICVISVCLWSSIRAQDVTYHMDEERPNSTLIGNVAEDSNLFTAIGETDSSSLTYSFLTTNNQYAAYFRVDEKSSSLYNNAIIDRETLCKYTDSCVLVLQIAAKSTLGSFFRILKVHIFINDINDHSPVFKKSSLTLPISESVLVGTSFAIDGAEDEDRSAEFSLKHYELESNDMSLTEALPFSIQFVKSLDGQSKVLLFVLEPLDREKMASYNLEIIAKDGDTPPRIGRLPVNIVILDVNDSPPVFSADSFNVTVNEETAVGSVIIKLEAVDADFEENGRIKFRLSPHQSADIFRLFQINDVTGEITLKDQIVYLPGKDYKIIVEAYDTPLDGQTLTAQAWVIVDVENSGNHAPQININMLSSTVSELANIGTVVAYVSVQDHDAGKQGMIGCIITSIDFSLQRMMNINDFKIIVAQALDYERSQRQNITVYCQDNGSPPMQASSSFTVQIKDENDHSPAFTESFYSVNIPEDTAVGAFILEVSATDLDSGNNSDIYFTVSSEYKSKFYFDNSVTKSNTANLRLNKSLDRELKSAYVFPIYAIDKGSSPKTGTVTVSIHLTDVNDEAPKFTQTPFEFWVLENLAADADVGRVTAIDNDLGKNKQFEFKMHPDYINSKVPFVVFADGTVKTNQELDREVNDRYEFKVIATDHGDVPLSSTGSVIIGVSDANDWDPEIKFPRDDNNTVLVLPSISAWHIVTRVIATDKDEIGTGNSKLRFSINDRNDSDLFQINPNTGEIQITKSMDENFVRKIFRLDIFVSDFGKPTERTAISRLIIKIHSQNVTETQGQTDVLSSQNFLIAIVVGVVTVVLSVGIVATIIIIRKIDQQRKENQNKTDNEDQDDMDSKHAFDGSITVFSLPSEDSLLEKKKKEVSFSLEDDVFSDDDLIQKNGFDHHHNRHFKPNLSYLSPGPKKVEDNHSETSGDTGTSDSGRGGSDEEIHTSMSQSPRDKMMMSELNRQIPQLSHQEIIPFSFKKGLSMPHHSDFDRPSLLHSDHELRNNQNDIEMSRRDLDLHRNGLPVNGMSTMAVHLHNDTLDRSRNKVVLLQTDSGIHSDTNSNEGDVCRDCMV